MIEKEEQHGGQRKSQSEQTIETLKSVISEVKPQDWGSNFLWHGKGNIDRIVAPRFSHIFKPLPARYCLLLVSCVFCWSKFRVISHKTIQKSGYLVNIIYMPLNKGKREIIVVSELRIHDLLLILQR